MEQQLYNFYNGDEEFTQTPLQPVDHIHCTPCCHLASLQAAVAKVTSWAYELKNRPLPAFLSACRSDEYAHFDTSSKFSTKSGTSSSSSSTVCAACICICAAILFKFAKLSGPI